MKNLDVGEYVKEGIASAGFGLWYGLVAGIILLMVGWLAATSLPQVASYIPFSSMLGTSLNWTILGLMGIYAVSFALLYPLHKWLFQAINIKLPDVLFLATIPTMVVLIVEANVGRFDVIILAGTYVAGAILALIYAETLGIAIDL